MPSGLAIDDNDPLARRDQGLEFLDVSAQMHVALSGSDRRRGGRRQVDEYKLTNNSTSIVDTHLLVVVQGLPHNIRLTNTSGTTKTGDPYLRLFLRDGILLPGQSTHIRLLFEQPRESQRVNYSFKFLSGQGNP